MFQQTRTWDLFRVAPIGALACVFILLSVSEVCADQAVAASTAAQNAAVDRHFESEGLAWIDWVIIGVYALSTIGLGWYFSRRQSTTEEYFVGSGNMNLVLIAFSGPLFGFDPKTGYDPVSFQWIGPASRLVNLITGTLASLVLSKTANRLNSEL